MKSRFFGNHPDGVPVESFTLENDAGASLEFMTLGGIVTSLCVPDRDGQLADVVLGFDRLEPYLAGHPYFGAIIGRVAGRIPGGCFTIDGKSYQLVCNDGTNHLHGGVCGLDKRLWQAGRNPRPDGADSVRLTYSSPDGEEGYPGNLDIAVTYTLTADHQFIIETEATCDQATPFSPTHHSYFNLGGEGSGTIFDHELLVRSEFVVPTDAAMTPLDHLEPVAGQPNDFNLSRRLGDTIPGLFLTHGGCFSLRRTPDESHSIIPAARLTDPHSGRVLEVFTQEPFLQFYTGFGLDGSQTGKSGLPYGPFAGLCLECQGSPNAIGLPALGNIVLRPGETFRRTTIYAFSVTRA